MSLTTKNVLLVIFFLINGIIAEAQKDSAMNKELNEYTAKVDKSFWPKNEDLKKIKTEMYFIVVHIRDSVVNSFEVFSSTDTVLKEMVHSYFLSQVKKYKFKFIRNHDFILPMVIKNTTAGTDIQKLNTDYNYLLWRNGKVKQFNDLNSITTFPLFIYRNSKSLTKGESLAPKTQ
jgi:hypothetical protein